MKIEIDANGILVIFPENGTERYAIKKWWGDWENGNACLQVQIFDEFRKDVFEMKNVLPNNALAPDA